MYAEQVPQASSFAWHPELQTALCYGHNSVLLLARQWTLMQVGCACDAVMDDVGYRARLTRIRPGVVVLCETLSREECSRAAQLAEELCPESRIVVMFNQLEERVPHMAHVLVPVSGGRMALARNISELLEQRGSASPATDS